MRVSSVQELLLPTAICGWIVGIGIAEFPLGRRWPFTSTLYALITIVGYGIAAKVTVDNVDSLILRRSRTGELISRAFVFVNIFLCIFHTVISWTRTRAVKCIVDRLERADEKIVKMGISRDYERIYRQHLTIIAAHYIFVVELMVVWCSALSNEITTWEKVAGAFATCYPLMIVSSGELSYVVLLRFIAKRFEQLNGYLKGMSTTTDNSPQHKRVLDYTRRLKSRDGQMLRLRKFCKTNDDYRAMRTARECHQELTNIGLLVNDTFGVQVLALVTVSFVFITGLFYRTSIVFLRTSWSREMIDTHMIVSVSWLAFVSYRIIVAVSACARATDASAATASIICHLHESTTSKAFRDEISNFTLRLSQYSLTFTACGCFTMNYRLIHRMVSSVTTYFVILVQIGDISSSDVFANATLTFNRTE